MRESTIIQSGAQRITCCSTSVNAKELIVDLSAKFSSMSQESKAPRKGGGWLKLPRTSLVPIYKESVILVKWVVSHSLFSLLPSAKTYRNICCCASRLAEQLPQAVRLLTPHHSTTMRFFFTGSLKWLLPWMCTRMNQKSEKVNRDTAAEKVFKSAVEL